jgi:hypothetical protein
MQTLKMKLNQKCSSRPPLTESHRGRNKFPMRHSTGTATEDKVHNVFSDICVMWNEHDSDPLRLFTVD